MRKRSLLTMIALVCGMSLPIGSFAETIHYTYDQMARVIRADYENGTRLEYVYDQVGNRYLQTITAADAPPNTPPFAPSEPSIPDGAEDVILAPTLSWTGGDPDAGDAVLYDVYCGPPERLTLAATGWQTSYVPAALDEGTRYCWQIIARDNHNASTAGPVWCFTTIQSISPATPTPIILPPTPLPTVPAEIPEPATGLLMGSGLLGLFALRKRKRLVVTLMVGIFSVMLSGPQNIAAQTDRPAVSLSVKPLDLARPLTVEAVMAAGQFGGQLYPTYETTSGSEDLSLLTRFLPNGAAPFLRQAAMHRSFGAALNAWNAHAYQEAVDLLRQHVADFPDSPWVGEAQLHIGCEAYYTGRYSESASIFDALIAEFTGKEYFGANMLLNKARSRLAVQKVMQQQWAAALNLFSMIKSESPDWRDRVYASHWIQRLSRQKGDQLALLTCGTQALAAILRQDGNAAAANAVLELRPNSAQGYSFADLQALAAQYGYAVTGRRLSAADLSLLPTPAVVQVLRRAAEDAGHYWIIEHVTSDGVTLFDPQNGARFHQRFQEFAQEWSGVALVFGQDSPPGRGRGGFSTAREQGKIALPGMALTETEMRQIAGGCCGTRRPEDQLGDPGRNAGPGGMPNTCPREGYGSPVWSVNMVNLNLYLKDIPLWHTPPIGPAVAITLSYNSQSTTAYYEPFGNKWQFNYATYLVVDPSGTVTIFMPDGRRDGYAPDGVGGYTPPIQVHNRLTRLAENHFELRFPDDTVYVYAIPAGTTSQQPFLIEIRDVYGQRLTFDYTADVRLAAITDALGQQTTLTYTADGLVERVTDPFGRAAVFAYDAQRNLIRITDMGGYWTRLSYDADVYLTGLENARGAWTFLIEPADGIGPVAGPAATGNACDWYPAPLGKDGSIPGVIACPRYAPPAKYPLWENYQITVTDPLGQRSEYAYSGHHTESRYISPRDYREYQDVKNNTACENDFHNLELGFYCGQVIPKTRYAFTAVSGEHGEIDFIAFPEGGRVQYQYDAARNRTRVTDALNHSTRYTYNALGRVTSIRDPKNHLTTLTYAPNGVDLTRLSNTLGAIQLTVNAQHDVTSITDRMGKTVALAYNAFGQLAAQTEWLNETAIVTQYHYDPATHELQQVTRDGQTLASFSYDPAGRVRTATDATGLTLLYAYNNLNHVTDLTYPDGNTVYYAYSDCCPRLVDRITDRAGRVTALTYDALKRLIAVRNPEGGITRYAYDPNGNLSALTDPKQQTTRFEYDLENRLRKKVYQDGRSEEWEYTLVGQVEQYWNARRTAIRYGYDADGNLTGVDYADSTPDVTYTYDAADRLALRQDGLGAWNFAYDANSRLTRVDGPWENDAILYGYDDLDRRISLTPQAGTPVTYSYDPLNRLRQIQTGAGSFTYAYTGANPLVQSLTRPDGSTTTYQYDQLNRLTELVNRTSSGGLINQYGYTYNAQDVRDSETITNGAAFPALPEGVTTYDYDAVNQLLRTATPEQLFQYDADGNLVQGYTKDGYPFTATYDAENRMTSLEYTDSSGVAHRKEYAYSGDGVRAIERTYENGSLTGEIRIVRDGLLDVQERDENNTVTREYTWGLNLGGGIGGLLNLKQSGQNYAYLYDGSGNVSVILNSVQAVVAAYRYDPFGNLLAKSGSLTQSFMFSTKRIDDQTGLYDYGFRWYAPAIGRWTTRDPLGEAGGLNLYAFVGNNPINLIDLYGLASLQFTINQNGGELSYKDDSGNTLWKVSANSGRDSGLNKPSMQNEPGVGPIPSGKYVIDLSNNAEPDKTASDGTGWGLYGWRLNETFFTKLRRKLFTNRGGGFYLHQDEYQGNTSGTAGCIGVLGNKNIKNVKSALENYSKDHETLKVLVEYE